MVLLNINCKHFEKRSLRCNKKEKRFIIFRPICIETEFEECDIADRYVKPSEIPPRPPVKP